MNDSRETAALEAEYQAMQRAREVHPVRSGPWCYASGVMLALSWVISRRGAESPPSELFDAFVVRPLAEHGDIREDAFPDLDDSDRAIPKETQP